MCRRLHDLYVCVYMNICPFISITENIIWALGYNVKTKCLM